MCLVCCTCIKDNLEYDFIVVGVGSGGSIMAARLSEPDNNWTVLALDRGVAHNSMQQDVSSGPATASEPNLYSVAQAYLLGRVLRNPRYYGIGGTAMINGMFAIAPDRDLLDRLWPTGWKWDDLLPYMIKMQNHYCYYLPSSLTGISDADCQTWHGQNGPVDIAPPLFQQMTKELLDLMNECNETIGFMDDYDNPTKQDGCYFIQRFRKPFNKTNPNSESIRASTWAAYLNGVNRANLQILDSATVFKLVFDEKEPTKCIGVVYEYQEQIYTALAKKEVILSAGAFDTPKLLQLSGVGPTQWLEPFNIKVVVDNPHVGRNFVDHMGISMAFETTEHLPESPWDDVTCGWLLKSGLKGNNMNWADIQIYCYSIYPGLSSNDIFTGQDPVLAYSQPSIPFITFEIFHTFPDASGTVKIQSSSPYHPPQIDQGWQNLSEYDKNTLQYAVDFVRNMTRNSRWGQRYVKQELFPGSRFGGSDDLHRRLNLGTGDHQVGTCALGKCADDQARVIGIENVRVCDTSLFPTQINVNPIYTLYSMCEKVADLIKKQHSNNPKSIATNIRNCSNFNFVVLIILILFKF